MPKRITKGTGMMEQEYISYDITEKATEEEAKSFKAHMQRWTKTLNGPDATLRDNAEKCRRILELNDASEADMNIRARFGEDSAAFLAKEWLSWFRRVQGIRERIGGPEENASDMETLVFCACELGKVHERMWWRLGIDPVTDTRREQLALERRKSRSALNSAEAQAQRRDKMRPKIEAAARWRAVAQDIADGYFARNPGASKSAAAKYVLKHWPNDLPPQKESTVRQAVIKS